VAERFGWIGASRQARAAERVDAIVGAWWNDWGLGDAPTRSESTLPHGHAWLGTHVAVRVPEHMASTLTGFRTSGNELGDAVQEAAIGDLVSRIPGAGANAPQWVDIAPARFAEARLGGTCFNYRFANGGQMFIALDRAAMDLAAPPHAGPVPSLATRHDLLVAERVRLAARLDLGSMLLGELRGLAVGDVLVTSAPLDRPAFVEVSRTHQRIAGGRIGRIRDRRAIVLAPTNIPESV